MANVKSALDVDMFVNDLYTGIEVDQFWLAAEKLMLRFIVEHLQKKHENWGYEELFDLLMLELSELHHIVKADSPKFDSIFNLSTRTTHLVFMIMKARTLHKIECSLDVERAWEVELDALGINESTDKYVHMLEKAPPHSRSLATLQTFIQNRVSA